MKANRENKGSKRSGKLLAVAGIIFIVISLCGGGCSGRHAMTAPYEQESTFENSTDMVESDFSVDEETVESTEAGGISGSFNRVGSQIFGVSEMLFTAVDSLNEAGN